MSLLLPLCLLVIVIPGAVSGARAATSWPEGGRTYYPTGKTFSSIFRLVLADGSEYLPHNADSRKCPFLPLMPFTTTEEATGGMCAEYYGKTGCCPPLPILWSWVATFLDDLIDDPCCQRNVERMFCAIGCSTLTSFVAAQTVSDGLTNISVYITNSSAQKLRESCLNTCSMGAVAGCPNCTAEGLINGINLMAFFSSTVSIVAVIGENPETGAALDMDVLEPCSDGHVSDGRDNCSSCYVLGYNDSISFLAHSKDIKSVSTHVGYCQQQASEMSDCCVHDRGFEWAQENLYNASASEECIILIKRLQCGCLCPREAPYISKGSWTNSAGNETCFVTADEALRLYTVCNISATGVSGDNFHGMWNSLDEFVDSLQGILTEKNISLLFSIGTSPKGKAMYGVVGSRAEDSNLIVFPIFNDTSSGYSSSQAPLPQNSNTKSVAYGIGIGVGVPVLCVIVLSTVSIVFFMRRCKAHHEKQGKESGDPSVRQFPEDLQPAILPPLMSQNAAANLSYSGEGVSFPPIAEGFSSSISPLPNSGAARAAQTVVKLAEPNEKWSNRSQIQTNSQSTSSGGVALKSNLSLGSSVAVQKVETLYDANGVAIATRHVMFDSSGNVLHVQENSL